MTYASETTVPVDRSRSEIVSLLEKFGADEIQLTTSATRARVGFMVEGLVVQVEIPLPEVAEFTQTEGERPRRRTDKQAEAARDQAVRSRWRTALLIIRAKLEAVSVGFSTIEREFLADVVYLPSGRTVGQEVVPQLRAISGSGHLPRLLGPGVNTGAGGR